MRFGIEIVTLGPLADPRRNVELAVAAEESGFELVAVWDHHAFVWGVPSADALVTLSAIAQATERILLLPFVMPLPRYRPHTLAFQLAALDRLSGGRLIVGAGLGGVPEEFAAFGEPTDARVRAELTDEALEIMTGLWSGQRVEYAGVHYKVDGVTLAPLPEQRPRPPVWVGADSRAGMRRAARWDGWGRTGVSQEGVMVESAADLSRSVAMLEEEGAPIGRGFDVAISGVTHGPGRADPTAYADAGATWWFEAISPSFGELDELVRRVRAGRPGSGAVW